MNQSTVVNQPWLSLVRPAWIVLAGYNLLPSLLGLPDYYHQLIALNPWPNNQGWTQATFSSAVAQTGLTPQAAAWIILVPALINILVCISLGLFIFWRKSHEWQGLLVSFVLVGLCGTFTGDRFQFLAALPPVWQVLGHEAGTLIWLAFFIFLTLFPEGHFSPPWMRWVALSLVLWFVWAEAVTLIFGQTQDWIWWFGFLLLGLILIGKVHSYQHLAKPVQRQQMRWFLLAIMVFSVHGILQFIFVRIFPISLQPGPGELTLYLAEIYLADLVFLLIPVAIGIAIFRYHLWDIDLIIRRTLQYGLLTVLLGLLYFGMVVILEQVFRALTGQESPLTVVLSTLASVALFNPLRRRFQAFIDRRFYRQKYDAGQAVAVFSAAARTETELNSLTGQMVRVVEKTVQPEQVWVWLKDRSRQP